MPSAVTTPEPITICHGCGAPGDPAAPCPICTDARQFVPGGQQRWLTLDELRATHRNRIEPISDELISITTEPKFAIGQRALLLVSEGGNVLFDCVSLINPSSAAYLAALGGVDVIVLSHPHFYATATYWAEIFGADLVAHDLDRHWRPANGRFRPFPGSRLEVIPGVWAIRLGGHFDGSSVLWWPAGEAGRGVLLTGDTISVGQDLSTTSFMYSFPNLIPLGPRQLDEIEAGLAGLEFDVLHAGFPGQSLPNKARDRVLASLARYRQHIT